MADSDSSTSSDHSEIRPDSEGWEDAEPDVEVFQIKDFFSDATFPTALAMIQHCARTNGFDFLATQRLLALDFYGSIKLANYIRAEAQNGNSKPDVSSKALFEDDRFLQPVLADDALLFCLDDLGAPEQDEVKRPEGKAAELEEELAQLRLQFAEYRTTVEKTLDERWTDSDPTSGDRVQASNEAGKDQADKGYFDSYSYNDIHQTMLQDTVRTDAYRDFIYANKDLFAGKVVLDVGCGTGILSLFCAKAGAAQVIAVDNSEIIEKARANIAANGLADRITCVRGKIEEIVLPHDIKHVDIIVSEWMGYCLLYEAMLDSVLYARDKYLKPDGLMVPSHCTLHLTSLADPEYVAENVTFWKDVYGFDMGAMMEKIYDDVLVRFPVKNTIAGRTQKEMPFKVLDLHTITVKKLQFEEPFRIILNQDVDELDGWCVWFDTVFMTSREVDLPDSMLRGVQEKGNGRQVLFTTGPYGPETHWRCGVCMVDRSKGAGKPLKQGQVLEGRIAFRKNEDASRALDIEMIWEAQGADEKSRQRWLMR